MQVRETTLGRGVRPLSRCERHARVIKPSPYHHRRPPVLGTKAVEPESGCPERSPLASDPRGPPPAGVRRLIPSLGRQGQGVWPKSLASTVDSAAPPPAPARTYSSSPPFPPFVVCGCINVLVRNKCEAPGSPLHASQNFLLRPVCTPRHALTPHIHPRQAVTLATTTPNPAPSHPGTGLPRPYLPNVHVGSSQCSAIITLIITTTAKHTTVAIPCTARSFADNRLGRTSSSAAVTASSSTIVPHSGHRCASDPASEYPHAGHRAVTVLRSVMPIVAKPSPYHRSAGRRLSRTFPGSRSPSGSAHPSFRLATPSFATPLAYHPPYAFHPQTARRTRRRYRIN